MSPPAEGIATTVQPLIISIAILCGLVLGGLALTFFALARTKALARAMEARSGAQCARADAAIDSMQRTVDSLASQVAELQRQAATVPAFPKSGFNLSKRSQALRMHRRGEAPEQIATALDVPLQEVDLLLKVHRIVITNI